MLMNNFPVLEDLTGAKTTINNFHEDINSSKYLLLCKDISYYTIFTPEAIAHIPVRFIPAMKSVLSLNIQSKAVPSVQT